MKLRTKPQIAEFLKEVSKGKCGDVPIYTFGKNNFENSTYDLCASLLDKKNTIYRKYECENIESPIDLLYNDLIPYVKMHRKMSTQLESIHDAIIAKRNK